MKIIQGKAGEQGTQEWLEFRKNHIMASDVPNIMGVGYRLPEQVFAEKLGLEGPQKENEAMARGKRLEPIARKKLNEMLRESYTNFTPIVTESVDYPFLGASLDGFCDAMAPHFRICEIKTGGEAAKRNAKTGFIPEIHQLQMQTQLLVSEADICFYAFYDDVDDDLTVIEVRPDRELQQRIVEAAKEFWERLQNLDPPEPKYEEKGDAEWVMWTASLAAAQAGIKVLETQEKEAKERLIQLSEGRSCKGYGYGVVHSVRQGSVDYKKVVEDYGIDEAKYRKEPTQVVTVRKMK